jgi:hypothetical protein
MFLKVDASRFNSVFGYSSGSFLAMRFNRSYEFDSKGDIIDVLLNILRHVIFVASKYYTSCNRLLIFIEFGI